MNLIKFIFLSIINIISLILHKINTNYKLSEIQIKIILAYILK